MECQILMAVGRTIPFKFFSVKKKMLQIQHYHEGYIPVSMSALFRY